MDRYNKYQTKQLHARPNTCTYTSWWLVLGWMTTKEYHPRLCIDYVDFMARYKCNYITLHYYCRRNRADRHLSSWVLPIYVYRLILRNRRDGSMSKSWQSNTGLKGVSERVPLLAFVCYYGSNDVQPGPLFDCCSLVMGGIRFIQVP